MSDLKALTQAKKEADEAYRLARFKKLIARDEIDVVEVLHDDGWRIRRAHWPEGRWLDFWPAQCVYLWSDGRSGFMSWSRLLRRLKVKP